MKLGDILIAKENYNFNSAADFKVSTLVEGVYLEGGYIKVTIDDEIGYVFSGYVSDKEAYAAIDNVDHLHYDDLASYISRTCEMTDSSSQKNEFGTIVNTKFGENVEISRIWNRASSTTYILKDWTVNEVLLLVLNSYRLDQNDVSLPKLISYKRTDGFTIIEIDLGEIENTFTIFRSGPVILVTHYLSC
ncbi:hypothetical protein A3850_011770 [Lewinella sp. 4G2]|nr:hypothetical protein A3850_011770 [Lewinella sp. 4G2]